MAERTVYERLCSTAAANSDRSALSFQIKSGPNDVHEGDVVAYLLPNCNEAVLTFLAASAVGVVCPVNPTLHPEQNRS